jgi:anti-sigma regulatory factor (Ser/Thr protein kinase)
MDDKSSRITIAGPATADRLATASVARAFGLRAGLSAARSQELAVAVAELASNVARHARDGTLVLRRLETPRPMIEIVCRDRGPGIQDPVAARRDGFSGGRQLAPDAPRREGCGLGLGAVERLMDEVQIDSELGIGTTVTARKWIP